MQPQFRVFLDPAKNWQVDSIIGTAYGYYPNRSHTSISKVRTVPAGMSHLAFWPTSLERIAAGRPVPGRLRMIDSCVRMLPARMSRAATRLFRATAAVFASLGEIGRAS